MTSAKIIELNHSSATCPECGSTEWEIVLDKFGRDWTDIQGFICVECEFTIHVGSIEEKSP